MSDLAKYIDVLRNIDANAGDGFLGSILSEIKARYPCDSGVAAALARVYADSGSRLPNWNLPSADVASTGGPSSLSTLIPPLYLQQAGFLVPKLGVAGRPAGGIDSLAQIHGYKVNMTKHEAVAVVNACGYVHFIADSSFAPLDARTFSLREKLGMKAVPTLVIASLLSKKIAVSLDFAGLDIRVSEHGNFGRNLEEAKSYGIVFVEAARLVGISATPVLTDNRFAYQPNIGRAESLVALDDFFQGHGPEWAKRHADQCRTMAIASLPEIKRSKAASALLSDLRSRFEENLIAQGAEVGAFNELVARTRLRHTTELVARNDGFTAYPLNELRSLITTAQQQELNATNSFPDPVGVVLKHPPSTWVEKGSLVATVRLSNGCSDTRTAIERLICCPTRLPHGPNLEAVDA